MATALSKTALARSLGVSRQALYYQPRRPYRDQILRDRILQALDEHPAYGSRALALHLKMNRKRIQRVMRLYSIRPKIMPKNRYRGKQAESVVGEIPNRMKMVCPIQPNAVWAGDFTHLWFKGRTIYLATIIDCCTREIIAWQMGLHHTAGLVIDVLEEAKRKRAATPQLFHSDQGSEYTSGRCLSWLIRERITASWSPKGKPWNNGMQESFFRTFKLEFGRTSQFTSLEALTEAIGRYMHYYNAKRIHRRLKMTPQAFFQKKSRRK